MTIHHLNCGSMCPYGGRIVSGVGGLTGAEIVCHCLLIETDGALVLVDTGVGLDDKAHRYRRLGVPFTLAFRPQPDPEEAAVNQVRALGHDPADVREIVATHLDLDHAGGLPDFPEAQVHVFDAEQRAAVNPSLRERARYPSCHFDHGPKWVTHAADGDSWFGFESLRVLPGIEPEIALIPLLGHSPGHCGVAVKDGDGWLFHAGDAYFHHYEVAEPPSCPPGLRAFQRLTAADWTARNHNQERLREIAREHGDEVRLFCSHDPVDLHRFAGAGAT